MLLFTADAVFTGESGGESGNWDISYYKIDYIRGMIDIISTYLGVNNNEIYALDICGGGEYTLFAAQSDKRIKNIATVSMFNTGAVWRESFQNSQSDTIIQSLHDVANLI